MLLFRCIDYFYIKKKFLERTSLRCGINTKFINEIKQEIFKRVIKPLYLFVISIIVSFLLINYKEHHKYQFNKTSIFFIGIIILIISEISITYSGKSDFNTLITSLLPLIFFIFSYLGLRNKLFKT